MLVCVRTHTYGTRDAACRLLMGEDRAEYSRRHKQLHELALQSAVSGKAVDQSLLDERPVNQIKAVNLLADLTSRAYSEEDHLMSQQKSDLSVQVVNQWNAGNVQLLNTVAS